METAKLLTRRLLSSYQKRGGAFYAGKSLDNSNYEACIFRRRFGEAKHVHLLAEHYGIAVILHTDHAALKFYPGSTDLLDHTAKVLLKQANHYFSSHMRSPSEEPLRSC